MAPRILIFSIAMGAVNSFYVKSIATYAFTFFGYIISVLAIVFCKQWWKGLKIIPWLVDVGSFYEAPMGVCIVST